MAVASVDTVQLIQYLIHLSKLTAKKSLYQLNCDFFGAVIRASGKF